MPYYAVAKGFNPGVYTNWENCKKQVNGYSGPIFKKFSSMTEAEHFIKYHNSNSKSPTPTVDTSEQEVTVIDHHTEPIIIFTDGACKMKRGGVRQAGYGYYIPSLNKRASGPIPPPYTNNRAELTAIILAIREIPPKSRIHIITDSRYCILIFTSTGMKYQQNGYRDSTSGAPVPNADLIRQAVLLAQSYKLQFTRVDSHTGKTDNLSIGNQIADSLAVEGALQSMKVVC